MLMQLIFKNLSFLILFYFMLIINFMIFSSFIFIIWNYYSFTITLNNCLMILSLFYCLYWFLSVFIFLIKKSYLGKFSSLIQRFWKRSFMIFWSIEIFLFLVYVFLICNNPEETFYMLDYNKLNKILLIQLNELMIKTLYLFYINIILYFYILYLKVSKKHLFYYLYIWFHLLLYIEYTQLFYFTNYFNNYLYIYDFEEKIWINDLDVLKSRTFYYYIYIFIILKYWHIFFIYYYMIISYWYTNLLFTNSYNWISSLYQNFFYIYLFNYIYLFIFLKKFFKYTGSIEYMELYCNQNLLNFIFYDFLYYFSIKFYLFIY